MKNEEEGKIVEPGLPPQFEVKIDPEKCTGCMDCLPACTYGVYEWDQETELPVPDHSKCVNCKRCEFECPEDAIAVTEHPSKYRPHGTYDETIIRTIRHQADTGGVMLAAGLEGIDEGYELPDPIEKDIYHLSSKERKRMGVETLPGSLIEAIKLAEESELVRKTLEDHIFDNFIESKKVEWDNYRMQIHPWEMKEYLPIL